jgi:hypothetical protein
VKDGKKGCIHLALRLFYTRREGQTRSEIPPRADIPGDAVVQKHRQRSCKFNGRQ